MNNYQNIKSSSNDFQIEACSCCFDEFQQTDYQYTYIPKTSIPFTGKELDSETGYSYFGARYYDAELSGLFFSVDPMADKYPNVSSYNYCMWNPIKFVDPDGNDTTIEIDINTGNLSYSCNDKHINGTIIELYSDETLLAKQSCTGYVSCESDNGGKRKTLIFVNNKDSDCIFSFFTGENNLNVDVPCFIHFNGQHYRFDDIAKNYGVITDKEEFDKYVPLSIIK